ncbi:hypothetical protein ABZX77_00205 [Streptomyces sp. NPDC004237]|uniref:hypothetical protein n=1 Tax=Streptomyces sp. NPDC004237 TaxID=3154455 RepID=UPI0033A2A4D6
MPEMYFDVRWPDGDVQRCYSPSTVIEDYFTVGFFCTGASGQLERLEETARVRAFPAEGRILVEALLNADGTPR